MSYEIEGTVLIEAEGDMVIVRKTVREATTMLGFGVTDVTRIVTAASELARNIFRFAGSGLMHWQRLKKFDNVGIALTFVDKGPGISNVGKCMEPGYTTSDGLGMGLPGTKRLMDEMEIQSEVGKGTTVIVKKWMKKL